MQFEYKQSRILTSLLLASLVLFGIYLLRLEYKYNLGLDDRYQEKEFIQERLLIAQKNENLSLLTGKLLDSFKSDTTYDFNYSINQLSNLTAGITPYPIQTSDTTSSDQISPERGLIFRTLALLRPPNKQWKKIKEEVNFACADLKEIDLSKYNLDQVQLEGANLQSSVLKSMSLNCATLNKANLWGANLSGSYGASVQIQHAMLDWANLNNTVLVNSQLGSSHLNNTHLVNANLYGSNMRFCQLKGSILNKANLEKVNLLWTDLSRSSLKSSNLKKCKLRSCNLEDTNFEGADMRGALLWDANFNRSILSDVKLDSAIVKEKNWFDKLDKWNVYGVDTLRKKYRMVPHSYANGSFMLQKMSNK